MKKIVFPVLVVALLAFISVDLQAQSKKDLEDQMAQKDEEMAKMKERLDALEIMYTATKEKVLKEDFDPAKFAEIIDSARAERDSLFQSLTKEESSLKDSVASLKQMNMELQTKLDSLSSASSAAGKVSPEEKEAYINELKQLKELVDSGILSQEEFENRKQKILEKW